MLNNYKFFIMRKITEEQFYEECNPIENKIEENASWNGTMFETYGEEFEFVKTQDVHNVWTIVEGENNDIFILSGFHLVNRIGYLITEEPWEEETEVSCDF